jgi:ABC-type antimicrobial peptide transport system permease subunit
MAKTLSPGDRIRGEFMRDRYAAMFSNEMIAASIMSVFSGLAFVVAIAGLYAVMAFLVASRTREIGIRVALGADRARIQRLVMGGSLALVATGAAIGGVTAFVGARWASSLLIGVSTTDPWTYAAVIGSVTIAALLATWQPARAAAAVDPTILLRD